MWLLCLPQVTNNCKVDYFYAKYTDWIEEFNSAFKEDKHLILDVNREK